VIKFKNLKDKDKLKNNTVYILLHVIYCKLNYPFQKVLQQVTHACVVFSCIAIMCC